MKRCPRGLQRCNRGDLAAAPDKAAGCFSLWSHRAGWKVQRHQVGWGSFAKRACARRAVVQLDPVDVGQKQQGVRVQLKRKERC
jgi:hypothetical protein